MVVAPVLREEADLLVTLFPKGSCFGIGWTLLHLIETARGWPIEETLAQCTSHEWRERMASRAALPASTP